MEDPQQTQRQRQPHAPLLPSALPDTHPSPSPTAPFTPIFTLITSPTSPSPHHHHHPHIHYIFSTDDPSALTTTALALLDPSPPTERYLLLDLDRTGTAITAARSLSPAFQILSAEISAAPTTWDGEGDAGDAGAGARARDAGAGSVGGRDAGAGAGGAGAGRAGGAGLMLKICGTEGLSSGAGEGMGMEAVVEEYEARMGELREVIARAGGGGGT